METRDRSLHFSSGTIPAGVLEIAASKSFTYPTRLASAWEPAILEINQPAYLLHEDSYEIRAVLGVTKAAIGSTRNLWKQVNKSRMAPLNYEEEYLFDCRFDADKNIAHILVRMVTSVFAARRFFPTVKAVIREKPSPMIRTVFELLEIPFICTDRDLYGKIITIPHKALGHYELLFRPLFESFRFLEPSEQMPERIFIARKGERSLINEREIEDLLQEYGFQKFYYEDIPIRQQWAVTQNANCIVALHGAALSSLVFNRNAVKLVELFHPGYVVNMYRHMVNAIGGTWCGVTGQITPDVIGDLDFKQRARQFALRPTAIDLKALRMALEHMQIGLCAAGR